jgi:release factor glutamine methyltransferase
MDHAIYQGLLMRLQRELDVPSCKPDETARDTLHCLWAKAMGVSLALSQTRDVQLVALDETAQATLTELVARRLAGEPLAYLTGRQDFMDVVLLASPAALVPRRETELLGWAALAKIQETRAAQPLVIDLCTGSGNLALALAVREPRARMWGSDLSPDAVSLARDNAEFLGRPDVSFVVSDLADDFMNQAFLGQIDVLICNPPYISSAKFATMHPEISGHEPRLAFDGGPFGIKILQRLLKDAPRLLKPGGWLLFEVGLGQGEPMLKRLQGLADFSAVEAVCDANGDIRALAARRAA